MGSYIRSDKLLKKTDVKKWSLILNKISDLIIEKKSVTEVIPERDHPRIRDFLLLFLGTNSNKNHKRFYKAIERQKELFI
jgi:hypothetical protein